MPSCPIRRTHGLALQDLGVSSPPQRSPPGGPALPQRKYCLPLLLSCFPISTTPQGAESQLGKGCWEKDQVGTPPPLWTPPGGSVLRGQSLREPMGVFPRPTECAQHPHCSDPRFSHWPHGSLPQWVFPADNPSRLSALMTEIKPLAHKETNVHHELSPRAEALGASFRALGILCLRETLGFIMWMIPLTLRTNLSAPAPEHQKH